MLRFRPQRAQFLVLAVLLLQAAAVPVRCAPETRSAARAPQGPALIEQDVPACELGLFGRADRLELGHWERLFFAAGQAVTAGHVFEGLACAGGLPHRIHLRGSPHGATLQAERIRLQV